jgi:hypothetical protein
MLFRRLALVGIVLPLLPGVAAQGNVQLGDRCELDADCKGNMDCTRTGLFESRCFPISCAKGAAQSILDFGFSADDYIGRIMEESGATSRMDLVTMMSQNNSHVQQAILAQVPPMEVFNKNFSACTNPETTSGGLRKLQDDDTPGFNVSRNFYGLQWSVSPVFSYFGKCTCATIDNLEEILDPYTIQLTSQCFGGILGADAGVDFLIQMFSARQEDASEFLPVPVSSNSTSKQPESVTFDPGQTHFVPIIIVGPFGLQVGWFVDGGPTAQTIIEITIGASFGLALGVFNACCNEATVTTIV